jgi:hypothetical protein
MSNKTKEEAIFIVDWDNTLFSTDYLKNTGFHFEYFFDNMASAPQDDFLMDSVLFREVSSLEEVNRTT